ncbi:MAG TPA: hypothetical protein VJ654_05835 [Noviherbaspirillum sp.]|nr:hypothetical protein [Noviherbaspirillum sp.]
MNKSIGLLVLAGATFSFAAHAKIPPPSPEKAAAAAAAKQKTDWSEKVAAYKLCQSQDRIAARYFKNHVNARKPSVEVPPCADPGPYVEAGATSIGQVGVADAKPVPAAGKEPPAGTPAAPKK